MAEWRVSHFDHVAISVSDVERSRAFYAERLGLTEIARPQSFDFPGAWFQIGPATLHVIRRAEPEMPGPRHFCLWVDDVYAAADSLLEAGCVVRWETKYKIAGIDRFFTFDPDDNRIEIQGRDRELY